MANSGASGRVHVIFKTHLDVGFTDLAENVVRRYFTEFIPAALKTAAEMRASGSQDRFVWTTGAWLIYEYLEQANSAERARLETAVAAGDIVWHAMPFTMHCELMEPELFRFGLQLSKKLDQRFGRRTISAKMTDVPGHTRGIVPLLAEAGVEFLHIGVNEASAVPDVPPVFVWREPGGAEIVVMYHDSYGATMSVPGLADSVSFAHTMDNRGPQSAEEVHRIFRELRKQYPGASVVASTLNDFAVSVRAVRDTLPVVTSEIGDTWIHGVATDPRKVAGFRELSRMRASWIAETPECVSEPEVDAFSRCLLMVPEHTWGLDDKTYLADYSNYTQEQFEAVVDTAPFAMMRRSWDEQRGYLDRAVGALGALPRGVEARERLRSILPVRPDLDELQPADLSANLIEGEHFSVGFDPATGAINELRDPNSGLPVADADHHLGEFAFQVFSAADYRTFLGEYISGTHDWSPPDFGKPGLDESDAGKVWLHYRLREAWQGQTAAGSRVVLTLQGPEPARSKYGGPGEVVVQVFLPSSVPELHLDVQWFDKPASRLPQACWVSFVPVPRPGSNWIMHKLGSLVSADDIVPGGNRRLHAVQDHVTRSNDAGSFRIATLDAPLISLGEPSLLRFPRSAPRLEQGIHFNLYNNVWGTNFPSWYGDDTRARFVLSFGRD